MKLLVTLLLVTAMFCAKSQDKFAPGYYVNESGDTVRGQIRYRNTYGHGIEFNPSIESKSQSITPSTARSFGFVNGKTYRSVNISIKGAPKSPAFVNVVFDGEVDLYTYQRQYVIGSETKGYYSLVSGKSSNDSEAMKNYQANTGAFNILFQDCATAKATAEKAVINDEKLKALLRSYHECRNVPYTEIKPVTVRRKVDIGLYAGYASSSLSFDNPAVFAQSSYLSNADFGNSSNVTFGVMALIGAKHPSSVVALETGIAYTSGSFDGTFVYENDFSGYSVTQTSVTRVEYKRVAINAGIRLTARANKFHPYASLGVSLQPFLSIKSNVNQRTVINDSDEVENFELNTGNSSYSIWAAAGIKMNVAGGHGLFIDVHYDAALIGDRGKITTIAPRIGFLF